MRQEFTDDIRESRSCQRGEHRRDVIQQFIKALSVCPAYEEAVYGSSRPLYWFRWKRVEMWGCEYCEVNIRSRYTYGDREYNWRRYYSRRLLLEFKRGMGLVEAASLELGQAMNEMNEYVY